MFFARYESSRLGNWVIESEHVLLGILREGDPVTTELWRGFNVSPERIRARYPTVEGQISDSAALPISEDVHTILAYALEESSARDEIEVTLSHLVLAILRVPACEAAKILAEHGVEYELVSEVLRLFKEQAARRARADARTPLVLQQSHYEFLDGLAASLKLHGERFETRQCLVLAIMDALSEDLTAQIHAALSKRLPGA